MDSGDVTGCVSASDAFHGEEISGDPVKTWAQDAADELGDPEVAEIAATLEHYAGVLSAM